MNDTARAPRPAPLRSPWDEPALEGEALAQAAANGALAMERVFTILAAVAPFSDQGGHGEGSASRLISQAHAQGGAALAWKTARELAERPTGDGTLRNIQLSDDAAHVLATGMALAGWDDQAAPWSGWSGPKPSHWPDTDFAPLAKPWFDAAMEADCDKLRSMMAAGMYPNLRGPSLHTAMHNVAYSSSKDRAQAAKALIELGADASMPDGQGWTPAMLLTRADDVECLSLVLAAAPRSAAAVDGNGRSAMHHAAERGAPAALAALKAAGCPIDAPDSSGRTPLARALQQVELIACAAALADWGADPLRAKVGPWGALDALASTATRGLRLPDPGDDVFELALATFDRFALAGVKLTPSLMEGANGWPGRAARSGDADMLGRLIALHPEAATQLHADSSNQPLLWSAIADDHPGCMRLLLDAGADPWQADGQGRTAFDFARERRAFDCQQILDGVLAAATRAEIDQATPPSAGGPGRRILRA